VVGRLNAAIGAVGERCAANREPRAMLDETQDREALSA
jgi:hypothetical protein